jgi:hypothetical protein
LLQETHFIGKDKHRLRIKGWKKFFWENGVQQQGGIAIFISDRVDFKPKLVIREKGHGEFQDGG